MVLLYGLYRVRRRDSLIEAASSARERPLWSAAARALSPHPLDEVDRVVLSDAQVLRHSIGERGASAAREHVETRADGPREGGADGRGVISLVHTRACA